MAPFTARLDLLTDEMCAFRQQGMDYEDQQESEYADGDAQPLTALAVEPIAAVQEPVPVCVTNSKGMGSNHSRLQPYP